SVGNAGTNTFKANFTPTDTNNYNTVSDVDVSVTVGKANPTYTIPTGLTATYGQALANVTLPTGWSWVNGTASVGDVGTNSFKATFTPADTANYNTVSDVNVSVTVGKANPTYTVPTGLTATYGQTLANVTLPTGWAWANNTQSVGNIGTNTFKANFTPADTANYNTVSGVDVTVTVGKAAGKDAVISTDTMSYTSDSIYIEGVAGQEYVIVPKGTAVSDADWNTSVKPDPERENWVFFENLNEATEYEIYTRTAETDTAFASDAVKANVYTTLSSIGYLYDSTLVGASITVEPDSDVEGLTYKWYQDEVTEDGEGAIHHNLTEIPGATGSTYTFRTEDAGKRIAVKIFAGDSEVGDVATDTPVALTAKVIFDSKGGSDVQALTDVVYKSKIKAPADPTREGFAFDGWYWDEEFETPFDFENDVITWNETTLYAKWTPNDYKITSVTGLTGANKNQWTKGGKDAVVFTVKVSGEDKSFDHFSGVKLDGKKLVKDVDYTAEKGSTVVTLKPETLEKLSVGEHTVTILFDNGEVNTTLTVLAANSQDATSPQTGDNSHMGLWIALMMLSLLGIAATLLFGRKKRVFDR
ncbi:MAG: InlB B-repeat-containing protein, partial [Clostridia bacterium]|nr:InlB B-repeat-containing protein [Clostridia bacterium]